MRYKISLIIIYNTDIGNPDFGSIHLHLENLFNFILFANFKSFYYLFPFFK